MTSISSLSSVEAACKDGNFTLVKQYLTTVTSPSPSPSSTTNSSPDGGSRPLTRPDDAVFHTDAMDAQFLKILSHLQQSSTSLSQSLSASSLASLAAYTTSAPTHLPLILSRLLSIAMMHGHSAIGSMLIDAGAEINESYQTMLHRYLPSSATRGGGGSSDDDGFGMGWSPVLITIYQNHISCLKMLLSHGAIASQAALYLAINQCKEDSVKLLVLAGVDTLATLPSDERSPAEFTKLLLKSNKHNVSNKVNLTNIYHILSRDSNNLDYMLLSVGLSPSAQLHQYIRNGHLSVDIYHKLLQHISMVSVSELNSVDQDGYAPILNILRNPLFSYPQICRLVSVCIENGADVEVRDSQGQSLFAYCVTLSALDLVVMLVESCADHLPSFVCGKRKNHNINIIHETVRMYVYGEPLSALYPSLLAELVTLKGRSTPVKGDALTVSMVHVDHRLDVCLLGTDEAPPYVNAPVTNSQSIVDYLLLMTELKSLYMMDEDGVSPLHLACDAATVRDSRFFHSTSSTTPIAPFSLPHSKSTLSDLSLVIHEPPMTLVERSVVPLSMTRQLASSTIASLPASVDGHSHTHDATHTLLCQKNHTKTSRLDYLLKFIMNHTMKYLNIDTPSSSSGLCDFVNMRDAFGHSPIVYAALTENIEAIDYLISMGASIHTVDIHNNNLFHLLIKGYSQALTSTYVLKLLDRGVDAYHLNNKQQIPLHYCALYNNISVIFVFAGIVNVDSGDEDGCTPMHLAALFNHVEVMEALTSVGANINIRNNVGQTPLMIASYCGHLQSQQLLFTSGCHGEISDSYGWCALHYLCSSHWITVSQLQLTLSHYAMDVNRCDVSVDSPLECLLALLYDLGKYQSSFIASGSERISFNNTTTNSYKFIPNSKNSSTISNSSFRPTSYSSFELSSPSSVSKSGGGGSGRDAPMVVPYPLITNVEHQRMLELLLKHGADAHVALLHVIQYHFKHELKDSEFKKKCFIVNCLIYLGGNPNIISEAIIATQCNNNLIPLLDSIIYYHHPKSSTINGMTASVVNSHATPTKENCKLNLYSIDSYGRHPLLVISELLCSQQISVNTTLTLLSFLCLENKIDISLKFGPRGGETILHRVLKSFKLSDNDIYVLVENFVKVYHIDVNIRSAEGETPLYLAIKRSHEKVIDILLHYFADPNMTIHGTSLLGHCAANFDLRSMRMLLKFRAVARPDWDNPTSAMMELLREFGFQRSRGVTAGF